MRTSTIIEILIDSSGSMGYMKGAGEDENKYLIDGQTRMCLVKKLLIEEVIPTIDYSSRIVVRTFRVDVVSHGEEIEQTDTQIVTIFDGLYEKTKIVDVINSLQDPPWGGTPITAAINTAIENLKQYPNSDRKIILLTDGEENGGGNYIEAAIKAEQMDGIPCKIFIIGVALNEDAEKKSKTIANGGYYNIKSKSFIDDELRSILAPLKFAVLKDSIQNLQRTLEIGTDSLNINSLPKINPMDKCQTEERREIDFTTLTNDIEYNQEIGLKSEFFLYKYLCERYGNKNIIWLNQQAESYKDHDFELLDENGELSRIIECKGTIGRKPTFYLTVEEWNCFLANKDIYQIYRIFNVDGEANVFSIENLFDSLFTGKVVPYLLNPEVLKERRIYLTILS